MVTAGGHASARPIGRKWTRRCSAGTGIDSHTRPRSSRGALENPAKLVTVEFLRRYTDCSRARTAGRGQSTPERGRGSHVEVPSGPALRSGRGPLVLLQAGGAHAENERVCVEITLKQGGRAGLPAGPQPLASMPQDAKPRPCDSEMANVAPGCEGDVLPPKASELPGTLPIGQRPLAYMKRLIEHFVSHEKGFVAVSSGCRQTVRVELYPLVDGWTAFASYTGTGREERVNRLLPGELSAFAERVATSLLYGKPISTTINRENVLVSDSKEYAQRIHGTAHFIMGLGTQLRVGTFDTAVRGGNAAAVGCRPRDPLLQPGARVHGVPRPLRELGPRGGAPRRARHRRDLDPGEPRRRARRLRGRHGPPDAFFRYFDPRGLTSFYLGAGSTSSCSSSRQSYRSTAAPTARARTSSAAASTSTS